MPVALHCHTNNWGQCNLRYQVVVDTSTFSLSGIGLLVSSIYLVSLGISLWFKQDLDVDNRQKTYKKYTFFLDNCFLSFIMIRFFISISSRKTIMVLWTAIRASALTISIWKCLKCFSAQPHSADSHSEEEPRHMWCVSLCHPPPPNSTAPMSEPEPGGVCDSCYVCSTSYLSRNTNTKLIVNSICL